MNASAVKAPAGASGTFTLDGIVGLDRAGMVVCVVVETVVAGSDTFKTDILMVCWPVVVLIVDSAVGVITGNGTGVCVGSGVAVGWGVIRCHPYSSRTSFSRAGVGVGMI